MRKWSWPREKVILTAARLISTTEKVILFSVFFYQWLRSLFRWQISLFSGQNHLCIDQDHFVRERQNSSKVDIILISFASVCDVIPTYDDALCCSDSLPYCQFSALQFLPDVLASRALFFYAGISSSVIDEFCSQKHTFWENQ